MKTYKRAANSGPVPYPDKSGRLLTDGVEGDEWESLVAIGYVVPTTDAPTEFVAKEEPKPGKRLPLFVKPKAISEDKQKTKKIKQKATDSKATKGGISVLEAALKVANSAPSTDGGIVMDNAIMVATSAGTKSKNMAGAIAHGQVDERDGVDAVGFAGDWEPRI